jgi:hypothetical protein
MNHHPAPTDSTPATPPKVWPWQLWLSLIAIFLITILAYYLFRPDFDVSVENIGFEKGVYIVTIDAANHTDLPTTAVIHVVFGWGNLGGDTAPPAYQEIGRNKIDISLPPKGRQTIRSALQPAHPSQRVNEARIEIASITRIGR